MKRVVLATAAFAAAVVVFVGFTLPPARLILPQKESDGTVAGVLHIHTNRSDGHGSPAQVAEAAARAGLKFIVLTDHGDATRAPDPPVYRDGVLCLDGVEISTKGGHYVAIGLPAAPYPLGGEPRDVVEDVARLGGFGIAAHPDSPKRDLQWTGWDAPFDGIEVMNPDTSWRVLATEGGLPAKLRLFAALADYPFRPAEAIAGLLTDSSQLLARYEQLTRSRRVVAVNGTDAHAQIPPVPIPTYLSSFRMLSVHVRPDGALSGNADADAQAILRGLREGHVYSAVDGLATPPAFQFTAVNSGGQAQQGDELADAGALTLTVRSNAPSGFTTSIWRGDQRLGSASQQPAVTVQAPGGPAVYRVEIHASDRRRQPLWIASNPIYVRGAKAAAIDDPRHRPVTDRRLLFDGLDLSAWRLEQGPSSRGSMNAERGAVHVRYELGNTESEDERVAVLVKFPQFLTAYNRVTFAARADRPMRLSVQLRTERSGLPDERWRRSVYLDTTPRVHTIFFDDLSPADTTPNRTPPLADMPYVLFVVDMTHARPGDSGEFWVSDMALEH